MTKHITIVLLVNLLWIPEISAQESPKSIAEKFFFYLKDDNFQQALESLPVSSRIKNDTAFSENLLKKLIANRNSLGEYCGFELIEQNEVSESYIIVEYLVKYMDAPRHIRFIFYKPKNIWQVNQVSMMTAETQNNVPRRPARRL